MIIWRDQNLYPEGLTEDSIQDALIKLEQDLNRYILRLMHMEKHNHDFNKYDPPTNCPWEFESDMKN